MFRIAPPDATWTHPVPVPVPLGDGKTGDACYLARFRLIPASRLDQLTREGDEALIREVLVGWSNIADPDGEPIAFGPHALAVLLDILAWRMATAREYVRFASGLPEKNSGAPPVAA